MKFNALLNVIFESMPHLSFGLKTVTNKNILKLQTYVKT